MLCQAITMEVSPLVGVRKIKGVEIVKVIHFSIASVKVDVKSIFPLHKEHILPAITCHKYIKSFEIT